MIHCFIFSYAVLWTNWTVIFEESQLKILYKRNDCECFFLVLAYPGHPG